MHGFARRSLIALLAALAAGCQHPAPLPLSVSETADAVAARSLSDPGLRALLESRRGGALEQWPLRRWDLDDLTLAAVYTQASLDVARRHVEVAQAGIVTAAERPNPNLSVSPELSANPGVGVSPWLATVQIDWPIETAGKRERRIEHAQAAEAASRLAVPVEAWRIRLALRTAVADYVAASARERALAAELDQQRRRGELLAQRFTEGAASQVDASLVRVAAMQAEVDLTRAIQQRLDAHARVAAAIGVPEIALDGIEIDRDLAAGADPLLRLAGDDARSAALRQRWDVRRAAAAYEVSEAALKLEVAKQVPDIHLGRGYQLDEGQNKFALGLAVDLPILNQNEGPIAEAQAARREAASRVVETQTRALAEVELALAHRRGAAEEERSMRALVDEQAARRARAHAAFSLGAVGALGVADAEIELHRAELAWIDAQARVEQALAELEAAVQGENPAVDAAQAVAAAAGSRP